MWLTQGKGEVGSEILSVDGPPSPSLLENTEDHCPHCLQSLPEDVATSSPALVVGALPGRVKRRAHFRFSPQEFLPVPAPLPVLGEMRAAMVSQHEAKELPVTTSENTATPKSTA